MYIVTNFEAFIGPSPFLTFECTSPGHMLKKFNSCWRCNSMRWQKNWCAGRKILDHMYNVVEFGALCFSKLQWTVMCTRTSLLSALHCSKKISVIAYCSKMGLHFTTSKTSMGFLGEFFGQRIIFKCFWPPRSPYLSSPHLKGKSIEIGPHTLDELEKKIAAEINSIIVERLR